MKDQWLQKFSKTRWEGNGELWLDPDGNEVDCYKCSMQIDQKQLNYSWSYDGQNEEGHFNFNSEGGTWVDSWHQPEQVNCLNVPNTWGLFTLQHSYNVPPNPAWGWRSQLSERPTGELVLQMTNIAPWGEEGRAVRMIFSRVD